jgi:hypothetical protein
MAVMTQHNLLAGLPDGATRFVQLPNELGHNAVWDFQRSPQGRYFVSVCGENELPLSALLYEFYPTDGSIRLVADIAKCWIVDSRQMPPSKIHTSLDFLPDGRLIMATHNTSPAPSHKLWLFEQHYEHPWEGYPGSIVMIVDPDTNAVEVRGIPVPRESIYGGLLGDDPRYYYFLGYMRGHFYRLNLMTNEVTDYGKVTEFASCRLVKDRRGRIYGGTYTGELWRYDPVTDKVVDLKVHFQSPHGTKYRRALIFALESPYGTLFLTDNVDGELLELDPETLEVTRHGYMHLRPEQPRNPYLRHAIGGLTADENFVLYYGLESYHQADLMRLVRWDVLNGREPENLGLVSPGGRQSHYICEMIYDKGKLHMVDVCGDYSPYILTVDVASLKPPDPETPAAHIQPVREADMHMNGTTGTFMHIDAEEVLVLPLHRTMVWERTPVRYLAATNERLYGISGTSSINLIEAAPMTDHPDYVACLYQGGGTVSCVGLGEGGNRRAGARAGETGAIGELHVAALTTDGKLLIIDLLRREVQRSFSLPADLHLVKIHCRLDGNHLLLGDKNGQLLLCDPDQASGDHQESMSFERLPDIILTEPTDAAVVKLDDRTFLFSGEGDTLIRYDLAKRQAEKLTIRTSSVKGRGFYAGLSGGVRLSDGSIVCGTRDGMLLRISSDLSNVTSYGRLHSSGPLREFVAVGLDAAVAIYGGEADAGHLIYYHPELGLMDLGRPRVIKDNIDLVNRDTEWANIHYLSCVAVSPSGSYMYVGSGETYSCVVAYRNPAGFVVAN